MSNPITFDEICVRMLLDSDDAGIAKLNEAIQALLHPECPECGSKDVETNGGEGDDMEAICCDCEERWNPHSAAADIMAELGYELV